MCSRFPLSRTVDEIGKLFRVAGPLVNTTPRYNIAPTQNVLAIIRENPTGTRVFAMLRWGLIPHWAKDASIATKLINARAETLADKPSFRDAYRHRRCVIPADGFYEWTRDDRHAPFAVAKKDRTPIGFGGLWEEWSDPTSGERIKTCTIITTEANPTCASIHDRMPVIIALDDIARWLGEEPASNAMIAAMLRPYPANDLEVFAVDKRVGNVRNDNPSLFQPKAVSEAETSLKYSPRLL
ncbi:MAG TPA: SOS response-associated peptidase [Magnetospirillaceae bacterium]